MTQYIDKSAIVAEIEKRIEKYATIDVGNSSELEALYGAKCHALKSVLTFIDTLETKEVDWEKELDFVKDAYYYFTSDERSSMKKVAKYFFELGLKAKGE